MDLFTLPFRLPLLPLQGVIRLGELIQDETERQLRDPARFRRELDQAQRRFEAGEISDQELTEIQDELTSALVTQPTEPRTAAGHDDDRR